MAKNRKSLSSLLVFLIIVGLYFAFSSRTNDTDTLDTSGEIYVHFLDVGQGDSAIIQSVHGNILIDAGTGGSKEHIESYINSLKIDSFEYAIFTHPHADHIGGAEYLIERYGIKNVIMPEAVSTSRTFEKMLDAIDRKDINTIRAEAGQEYTVGEISMKIFAPAKDFDFDDNLNNASVVTKISFGKVDFLFMGDAETEVEKEILQNYYNDISVEVLKVGHHGSFTSSSKDFVKAAYPIYAIISAGEGNEYGHPHAEVVERYEKSGAEILSTYEMGDIVFSTNGESFELITKK